MICPCVKFPKFLSLAPCMRTTQLYVDDPWDVPSYRTKLETLYRVMHGFKKRSKIDAAKVQQYSLWLIPRIEDIYRYMKQKYTNISVLSSMMLPVTSVLRRELGLNHPTTDKWRREANELRIQATQETAHNIQGKDFKTFQEICCRRDAIKRRIDSYPANTSEYWKWFALCLYTMQPPLRADWASFSIIKTSDPVPSTGNHLILTAHKATILIRDDKVSKRKGEAQIPVTAELHAVLLESVSKFPRSVVVPHTKSSRKALQPSYTPDKHISKVNLSKLLGQAMASEQDNTPWPRPIQGLRKAHSTLVMSSNASYHTIKQVADAQRHSVSTMMCHYNAVPPSCSVEDGHKARSPEERIASAIQQNDLSHSNIIIIMTPCAESHGNESPAWTLYCSNPELQEIAEQGLAIIQDSCISGGR